jgi:hypothetical protein
VATYSALPGVRAVDRGHHAEVVLVPNRVSEYGEGVFLNHSARKRSGSASVHRIAVDVVALRADRGQRPVLVASEQEHAPFAVDARLLPRRS